MAALFHIASVLYSPTSSNLDCSITYQHNVNKLKWCSSTAMPLQIAPIRVTLQCPYLMLSRSKSFKPLIHILLYPIFIFPSFTSNSFTNSGSKIGIKCSPSPRIKRYCQSAGVCAWRRIVSMTAIEIGNLAAQRLC